MILISFCIRIGHGPWLGRNIPSLWYCTTSQKRPRIDSDYLWPRRLVHYSTATLLHNSLVTRKNKLSFVLALVHHFLLRYCTTSQKRPRIDSDYLWPRRLVHYSTATLLHNSLVTRKNKLSFVLVHHFLLRYCTTPQKCPRIDYAQRVMRNP
jgi:hypothetical protein